MDTPLPFSASMCAAHFLAAQTRWPIAGGLKELCRTCLDCRRQGESASDANGHLWLRTMLDVPEMANRHSAAIHEAGHAIVGVLVDHSILSIETSEHWGRDTTEPAAWVNRGPFNLPAKDHAAMVYAGQVASRRWLVESGYDSPQHRVDVTYLGHADTAEVYEMANTLGVPRDIGWGLAHRLVRETWTAIGELAEVVLEQRFTPVETVREILAAHPPQALAEVA